MAAAYHLHTPGGERLVKANSRAQAVNFAVKSSIIVSPVTAADLVAHMDRGLKVEDATSQEKAA